MIDPSKSGLAIFGFKPYEIAMLRIIWRDGKSCSRDIHNELKKEGFTEARPTIIVALNKYTDRGLLISEDESDTKHSRVWYSPHPDYPDERTYIRSVLEYVYRRLYEEFPDHH